MNRSRNLIVMFACVFFFGCVTSVFAGGKSTGQTLYVPCYSEIHHGIKTRTLDLTVTLSFRNIDPKQSIQIDSVGYYDTDGKKLRSYLDSPESMKPLDTRDFIVDQTDSAGGTGANFIVHWSSKTPVNPPIAESVMIGTSGNQGISFVSRGVVLED